MRRYTCPDGHALCPGYFDGDGCSECYANIAGLDHYKCGSLFGSDRCGKWIVNLVKDGVKNDRPEIEKIH